MPHTITIAKRELLSLFYSPVAYVVLGLFAIGSTLIFFVTFTPGAPATMRPTFEATVWLLVFLLPALSMRLFSEEFRGGTIEPLMTAPVSDWQVVLGKWLGAYGFYLVTLLPLGVLIGVLAWHGSPDGGPIATGLLGLLLVGALYLAIGVFASAGTQNQIIAFLSTVAIISVLTFVMYYLSRWESIEPWVARAMEHVNVNWQFSDFVRGLIDVTHVIYFLSTTALFLFLAVKLLESGRWR